MGKLLNSNLNYSYKIWKSNLLSSKFHKTQRYNIQIPSWKINTVQENYHFNEPTFSIICVNSDSSLLSVSENFMNEYFAKSSQRWSGTMISRRVPAHKWSLILHNGLSLPLAMTITLVLCMRASKHHQICQIIA